MEIIAFLPRELTSKIFLYVGNTVPYIKELADVVSKLNDSKTYCDRNDNVYSYESSIDDEEHIYRLYILYSDFIGDFMYRKEMNVSKAILLAITRKCCVIIEDYYQEVTMNKLNFDIFNIVFVDDDEYDDDL
jgi:hypothetical protein